MKFKVGDVVELRSGGPLMTVQKAGEGQQAVCCWHVGHAESSYSEFKLFQFQPEMLRRVVKHECPLSPIRCQNCNADFRQDAEK